MLSERDRRLLEEIERSVSADVDPRPVWRPPRWRAAVRRWPWGWATVAVIDSVSLFLQMGDRALRAEDDGAGIGSTPVAR